MVPITATRADDATITIRDGQRIALANHAASGWRAALMNGRLGHTTAESHARTAWTGLQ